jgi:hypothetical protein
LHALIDAEKVALTDQITAALEERRLEVSGMTIEEVRQAAAEELARD